MNWRSCNRPSSDQSSVTSSSFSACKLFLPADRRGVADHGRCFFAGGVRFAEQTIKATAAQLNASLLLIAVIAVLIPSAFHFSITTSDNGEGTSTTIPFEFVALTFRSNTHRCRRGTRSSGDESRSRRLAPRPLPRLPHLSNVVSCRQSSHAAVRKQADIQDLYTDEETSLSTAYPAELKNSVHEKLNIKRKIRYRRNRTKASNEAEDLESATSGTTSVESPGEEGREGGIVSRSAQEEEDEEELPQMSIMATIVGVHLFSGVHKH